MNRKIDDITEKLEQGVREVFDSDRYTQYLSVMSRFYRYSANNCLLIMMQCPEATLVAGYRSWQEKFKRQVKKGEQAIRILAPCPHKVKKIVDDEEKEITYTTFRAVPVFDLSQTEGEALPTICDRLTGAVEDFHELLDSITAAVPVPVRFDDIPGGAAGYFSSCNHEIVMQEGMSEEQTIKTLIHECAHAILHNKENGEEKEADRATKEVQAESVAYVVCQVLGIDTASYSFEYVAGYSKDRSAKELIDSTEVIRKTALQIIDAIAA